MDKISTTSRKLNESSPKMPQCAETIKQMFEEADIKEYEPHLALQLCDIAYALTKQILVEARSVSEFCGKKQVDRSDVDFAVKAFDEKYCKDRPPKGLIAELASEKNVQPLPQIRQNFGLRLPNDRFCQLQPNYAYLVADSGCSERIDFENSSDKLPAEHQRTSNNFCPETVSSSLMNNNNNVFGAEDDYYD